MFPAHHAGRNVLCLSSRMISLELKKYFLPTLCCSNKAFSTIPSVCNVNQNQLIGDIFLNKHSIRHLYLMCEANNYFTQKRSYSELVDNEYENDKPTSKSPVTLRRDRLESQASLRSILSQKGDKPMTAEDWNEIKQMFSTNLKEKWEVFCMHTLFLDKNLSAGKSLVNYLTSQNVELDQIVLTFYIGLLGVTANNSTDQENEVKTLFDMLKSRTEVLDAASIEVLISALSRTKYYLECLPLLDIYKEFNCLGPGIMCDILEAGLKYHNVDMINMAFTEFNIGAPDASQITSRVPQLVETCLLHGNSAGMDMVMDFLRIHLLQLSKPDLEIIIELMNQHQPDQWTMKFGHIQSKSGVCSVCRSRMKEIEINDDEFFAVRDAFLNQVIVGKNVFYKSSVVEVRNFTHFIKVRNPFDVVIDGLNVVHRGKGGPSKSRLDAVLTYFLDRKMNVLLLGSKILMKYLPRIKQPQLLHIFLTETTKADDVFYLYAALHSGKDCLIVTSDKLRDHKFLLQKDLRPIFYKWLKTVQIHRWYSPSENFDESRFSIVRRDIFDVGPVKDNGGWHIPLNDIEINAPFGNMGILCLRQRKAKNSEHSVPEPDLQLYGSPLSQSDNLYNSGSQIFSENNGKLSYSHNVKKQDRAKQIDSHLISKHHSMKEKLEWQDNRKNNSDDKKQKRNKLEWFEM